MAVTNIELFTCYTLVFPHMYIAHTPRWHVPLSDAHTQLHRRKRVAIFACITNCLRLWTVAALRY